MCLSKDVKYDTNLNSMSNRLASGVSTIHLAKLYIHDLLRRNPPK